MKYAELIKESTKDGAKKYEKYATFFEESAKKEVDFITIKGYETLAEGYRLIAKSCALFTEDKFRSAKMLKSGFETLYLGHELLASNYRVIAKKVTPDV